MQKLQGALRRAEYHRLRAIRLSTRWQFADSISNSRQLAPTRPRRVHAIRPRAARCLVVRHKVADRGRPHPRKKKVWEGCDVGMKPVFADALALLRVEPCALLRGHGTAKQRLLGRVLGGKRGARSRELAPPGVLASPQPRGFPLCWQLVQQLRTLSLDLDERPAKARLCAQD